MAGWDPRTNYGVGTKVSVPDYTSSFSGGPGSTGFSGFKYTPPQSWDPKGNNIGSTVDWGKAVNLKFDGIKYQEPVFNPEREEREKTFQDLFAKTRKTPKWQESAGASSSDFSIMPGIGAQSGKLGDNLSFVQPASPSSMVIPGSGGMGGAIGGVVGGLASLIPGVGPGIAALLPSIGGAIGGAITG